MQNNFENYKPSLLDRIALFRKSIRNCFRINSNTVLFICEKPKECIYLKFSYPGNIQYHKIEEKEIKLFADAIFYANDLITKNKSIVETKQ